MEQNLIDIYDLVEHAIDNAFDGQMNLKFYDYLKSSKIKKNARKTLSLVFSTNIEKQLVQITIGNNQDIRTKSSFIERKTAALLSADGNIIRRIKK